ncbi:hypothetical protein [Kitasatospora sp. NPDC059800]|uniref:hypothetical protein n=1 Tax=Kitasatospora sp. NPDC059800 TaxID=3346951 RepID=UPI00366279F6
MTSTRTSDVDDQTLVEYALGLDIDYKSWPSRWTCGRNSIPTHVELFSYTEYPLSIRAKSNYRVAAKLIQAAAGKGHDDAELSNEHVVEVGGSAIHYGSATSLYVQVYEGGCELDCPGTHTDDCSPGCDPDFDFCLGESCEGDCHGTRRYTAAFREGVALAEQAEHGYPVLDEEDYSALEDEKFQENLQAALDDLRGDFCLDEERDHEAVVERAHEDLRDLKYEAWSAGEVSTRRVAEVYSEHRDSHFDALARDFLRGAITGQIELIAA